MYYDSKDFRFFVKHKREEAEGVIDFDAIACSTHHERYIGFTWYEALLNLKRRVMYLDLLEERHDAACSVEFYRNPNRFKTSWKMGITV